MVVGAGAVGSRAARQLAPWFDLVICDRRPERAEAVAASLGSGAAVAADPAPSALAGASVVVIARPEATDIARDALDAGAAVVSTADGVVDVRGLLALDGRARSRGLPVVVGAGMAPGLTCVLAKYAAAGFSRVDEVHVAKSGTGGPACARQHHAALSGESVDWRDGDWQRRRAGSGRELCWFPDPVCGRDCYRAEMADGVLLVPAFPGVSRVTARLAATRRDRLTSALPMLRAPHPEGQVGAVRVEVRGRGDRGNGVEVLGVIDRPAVAAGAVAAVAAQWATSGRLTRSGAGGLAELVGDARPFLAELARRGVKAAVFAGVGS